MKRTGFFILTLLLISAFLCACSYNTYSIEKIGDVMESASDETAEEEKVNFTAEIATEDFLAATDYYFFLDDESGEYTKVLFKTDYTITDIKFFSVIQPQITVTSSTPVKGDIILKMQSLTPDKPLVIDVKTEGYTAVRGISFTDPNGNTQYYTVTADSLGGIVLNSVSLLDHAGLSVEYAGKNFLENPENYHLYEDKKAEYSNIIYKCGSKVTDFKFLSIEQKNDGGFAISKVLYTIEEFGVGMPFAAETAFGEAAPVRGITFVDEHGVTRYFTVNYSVTGDKSIVLDEVGPMTQK